MIEKIKQRKRDIAHYYFMRYFWVPLVTIPYLIAVLIDIEYTRWKYKLK